MEEYKIETENKGGQIVSRMLKNGIPTSAYSPYRNRWVYDPISEVHESVIKRQGLEKISTTFQFK